MASTEYASPWHTVSAIATPDHIWDELSDDYQELLSPVEAHRAIYIDFEGSKDQEPALLGSLWAYGKTPTDDKLRCVHDIHHPSLKPVVGAVELSADDLKDYQQRFRSVEQSLNALLLLAQAQNRLVVSWSPHEFVKVVEHGLSADLFALFQRTYRDGKATAMAWLEQEERSVAKGSNTLVHYLDATGYPIPEEYGLRKTTKRLNSVINGVKKKGSYEALIASQKKNWENLLIHNFTDCHGLRHVTKFASAVLPRPGTAKPPPKLDPNGPKQPHR